MPRSSNLDNPEKISENLSTIKEFDQEYLHYLSLFSLYNLNPSQYNKDFVNAINFISRVIHLHKRHSKEFLDNLKLFIEEKCMMLHAEMKLVFLKVLITLRRTELVELLDLSRLLFDHLLPHRGYVGGNAVELIGDTRDKMLRKIAGEFLISDTVSRNLKRRDNNLNSALQNLLHRFATSSSHSYPHNGPPPNDDEASGLAGLALRIMTRLYAKGIWRDAKTVNFLAHACFSSSSRIMSMAINFFLNPEFYQEADDQNQKPVIDTKQLIQNSKIVKKTKSRIRKMKKSIKHNKRLENENSIEKTNVNTLTLINLLHDSQEFAEKLFRQLQQRNEGFDHRMATIDLVSRIIGLHKLQILNFYVYMERYIQPHQSNVTRLLLYLVQSVHDFLPAEILKPLIIKIANNFITEKNSGEVITVGLNSIRELCNRNPLVMEKDLLNDLELYKSYKNKNVVMASRSLINLFRQKDPSMLLRKDRGKVAKDWKNIKPKPYGHSDVISYIEGIECLELSSKGNHNLDKDQGLTKEQVKNTTIDTNFSTNIDAIDKINSISQLEEISASRLLTQDELRLIKNYRKRRLNADDDYEKMTKNSSKRQKTQSLHKKQEYNELDRDSEESELVDSAKEVVSSESDDYNDDETKSDHLDEEARMTESIDNFNQKANRSDKVDDITNENLSKTDDDSDDESDDSEVLPSLGDIERIYKLPKMKKADRIRALRMSKLSAADDPCQPKRATTNRGKRKLKPFMMVRSKMRGKRRARSFKEKEDVRKKTIKQNRRFKKMNHVKRR
ncbi:unnamed protein product [Gordionus sp. m RMFG-2023]